MIKFLILLRKGLVSFYTEGPTTTIEKAYRYIVIPFVYEKILRPIGETMGKKSELLLFGSKRGKAYGSGNSRYVFEWIHENRDDLDPVWLTDNESVYLHLKDKGFPVVKKGSLKGLYLLSRAKIGLISNHADDIALSDSMIPKSMTIINLDHGSPVKLSEKSKSEWHRKKWEMIDYWIKRSKFHANAHVSIVENEPELLITGFPRDDIILGYNVDSPSQYLDVDTADTVILYAPTKRMPHRWEKPLQLFPFDDFTLDRLIEMLESEDAVLLINLHPTTMEELSDPDLEIWCRPLQKKA